MHMATVLAGTYRVKVNLNNALKSTSEVPLMKTVRHARQCMSDAAFTHPGRR